MSSDGLLHTRAVVCVPARNEAEHIGNLLTSLQAQTRSSERLKVVVVSNNSTDETAHIARGFAAQGVLDLRVFEMELPSSDAHVGTARRIAMNEGAAWSSGDDGDGVLLSTDADAVVPADWVEANVQALTAAEIVGGRLIARHAEPVPAHLQELNNLIERYWSAIRTLEERLDPLPYDPAPRHGDHTGASLALRAGLYAEIGGVPALRSGEDRALVESVEKAGGRLRHCPHVAVEVSARRQGRAEGGMAQEMVRRERDCIAPDQYELPAAAYWQRLIEERAALRRSWDARTSPFVNAIAHVAHLSRSAGSIPHVPVRIAVAQLEKLIGTSSAA